MSARLNIGLIGSGFMGQAHADAYRRAAMFYPDLPKRPHLYALADQDQAMAERHAAKLGAEKAYGDWRELVNDPQVDVVDITSPNHLHYTMAMAAIAACLSASVRSGGFILVLVSNPIQASSVRVK